MDERATERLRAEAHQYSGKEIRAKAKVKVARVKVKIKASEKARRMVARVQKVGATNVEAHIIKPIAQEKATQANYKPHRKTHHLRDHGDRPWDKTQAHITPCHNL